MPEATSTKQQACSKSFSLSQPWGAVGAGVQVWGAGMWGHLLKLRWSLPFYNAHVDELLSALTTSSYSPFPV